MKKYRLYNAAKDYSIGPLTLIGFLLDAGFTVSSSNPILSGEMIRWIESNLTSEKKATLDSMNISLPRLDAIEKINFGTVFRGPNSTEPLSNNDDFGSHHDEYCPACQETPCQCSDPQWKGDY